MSTLGNHQTDACHNIPELPDIDRLFKNCTLYPIDRPNLVLLVLLILLPISALTMYAMNIYILPLIRGLEEWPNDNDEPSQEHVPLQRVETKSEQSGAVAESADGIPGAVATEEKTKGSGDQTESHFMRLINRKCTSRNQNWQNDSN